VSFEVTHNPFLKIGGLSGPTQPIGVGIKRQPEEFNPFSSLEAGKPNLLKPSYDGGASLPQFGSALTGARPNIGGFNVWTA
jgi:hypothetical protein